MENHKTNSRRSWKNTDSNIFWQRSNNESDVSKLNTSRDMGRSVAKPTASIHSYLTTCQRIALRYHVCPFQDWSEVLQHATTPSSGPWVALCCIEPWTEWTKMNKINKLECIGIPSCIQMYPGLLDRFASLSQSLQIFANTCNTCKHFHIKIIKDSHGAVPGDGVNLHVSA